MASSLDGGSTSSTSGSIGVVPSFAGSVAVNRSMTDDPAVLFAAIIVRVRDVMIKHMAKTQVTFDKAEAAVLPDIIPSPPPPPPRPNPPPSDRCKRTTPTRDNANNK